MHHGKRWAAWSTAGIKFAGRSISSLRYPEDTILVAESGEELNSLLMKVKEESEKAGFKLSVQKIQIMVSSLITSWRIDGETMETVTGFVFLGSNSLQMMTEVTKLKNAYSLEEKL